MAGRIVRTGQCEMGIEYLTDDGSVEEAETLFWRRTNKNAMREAYQALQGPSFEVDAIDEYAIYRHDLMVIISFETERAFSLTQGHEPAPFSQHLRRTAVSSERFVGLERGLTAYRSSRAASTAVDGRARTVHKALCSHRPFAKVRDGCRYFTLRSLHNLLQREQRIYLTTTSDEVFSRYLATCPGRLDLFGPSTLRSRTDQLANQLSYDAFPYLDVMRNLMAENHGDDRPIKEVLVEETQRRATAQGLPSLSQDKMKAVHKVATVDFEMFATTGNRPDRVAA